MAETDPMSPDSSPSDSKKNPGIRRVNNMPLVIAIAIVVVFLLLIAMVAAKRNNDLKVDHDALATGKGGDSSLMAADIVGDRSGGLIEKAQPEPLLPTEDDQFAATPDGVPIVRLNNPDAPPMPPRGKAAHATLEDPEDAQLKQMKMQAFQAAVGAKTTINMPDVSSVGSDPSPQNRDEMIDQIAKVRRQIDQQQSTDPNTAYLAQLKQVQDNISGASDWNNNQSNDSSEMMLTSSNRNAGKEYNAFDRKDRWSLDDKVKAPTSPFEIRAGSVIPGIMLSGINSDLPGQIMAQVSQNVYDTATGRYLLIPQGTRMIGAYSSDVGFGQEGVLIAWQRLVFPDGKALDIGSMPGADMAGYSGFRDKVNNHLFRIYSSALFMAGITAGTAISTNQGQNNNTGNQQPSVGSELNAALGQQLGQVSAQIVTRNLNVAPTLEIRPGYRFNIVTVKDVTFTKPYQSFDY
ncbi:TrbI/VirB10 family protein [Pseudomonas helleri]|uniref:TrbI/VirB10 family protein n=1 Tax=Pseudomonas helleri TaxID=1608996 RepID=UPI003FD1F72C